MGKNIGVLLLLAALTGLLVSCAGKGSASPETQTAQALNSLTGTFVNDNWTLAFKANGTYTISSPAGEEKCTYTISGGQMSIKCKSCGDDIGIYAWHNDGTILTLKVIDEKCIDRSAVLSTAMWYAQP